MGGVSAAVSKTAAAPIERIKLLVQNQVRCHHIPAQLQLFARVLHPSLALLGRDRCLPPDPGISRLLHHGLSRLPQCSPYFGPSRPGSSRALATSLAPWALGAESWAIRRAKWLLIHLTSIKTKMLTLYPPTG